MEFERYTDVKRLNFICEELKKNLPQNGSILDVGCGNGVITRKLGEYGFKIKGIDISEKAIQKAKSLTTLQNVEFEAISAEQLAFEGRRYHAIICSEVLEHLADPGRLLRVLYQCLYDNGFLIVTVPNGKGPRETFVTKPFIRLQQRNNRIWTSVKRTKFFLGYRGTTTQSDADDLTHLHFFTRKMLKQLAKENSFTIEAFKKTNFIEDVFPFSLITKRIRFFQKLDCAIAELLPYNFTGGFISVWRKDQSY